MTICSQLAENQASRVALGTVPGTVREAVLAVVLDRTWDATLTAKSTGSWVVIGAPNSAETRTLSRRATGRASGEATGQACCRPISPVVCLVIRSATCGVSCKVRRGAYLRAVSPVPTGAAVPCCCSQLREVGWFPGRATTCRRPDSLGTTCGESRGLDVPVSAGSRTHK